mgnify:FL=1
MTSLLLLARAQAQKFSAARRQPSCHLLSHYLLHSLCLPGKHAARKSLQQLVHIEAEKGNTWPTAVHLSRQKEFFPRCAGGCLSLVALRATGRAAQRATEALHRRGHRLQSAEASMLTDMGIVTMHAWRWCHPARCDRGGRQTGPREPGYCWISIALQKPL